MRPRYRPPDIPQSLRLLLKRFGEERLAQTAGSLTFTTLISMVPLLAVGLSIFTAFPAFHRMQEHLQQQFAHALLPQSIAETVFRYLNQFAAKAKGLGAAGVASLIFLATSMMLTVDKALNAIWRTARPRPLAQRVLLYWAGMTLGPLVLGAGLAASTALMAAHRGWVRQIPGGADVLLTLLSWGFMGTALGALYRFVPNTEVKWRDALAGGFFASVGFDLAGRAFAWYVASMPTFTAVYGTFATLPIFLMWIYWSWMVLLLGAMLAAFLPLLRVRALPVRPQAGADFLLALQLLRQLALARNAPECGRDTLALARSLRLDPLYLQPLLNALEGIGWIGRVAPGGRGKGVRWALLVDPAQTPVAALVDVLLLDHAAASQVSPLLAQIVSDEERALTLERLLAAEA
ncbi:YihY family inner membrane protein [Thiomonas sp.]|uniref:YihY family inner membrane protein n=1 Tax=Thiomonas sp. TaxID=2047785 RepID=UPI00258EF8A5|nr:YihY family inner membrane protein [Thiomonas sp.]